MNGIWNEKQLIVPRPETDPAAAPESLPLRTLKWHPISSPGAICVFMSPKRL